MKLYQANELKHSRIFFDKQPPRFLTVFILFTLATLLLGGWFTTYLPKNYLIEARGTIITTDNTYVGSFADGILVQLNKAENAYVEKGDVLFTISSGNEKVESETLTAQLAKQEAKLEAMDLFVLSLQQATNHMENAGIQQEYYAKVEYYLAILRDEQQNQSYKQTDISEKQRDLEKLEQDIKQLERELAAFDEEASQSQLEAKQAEKKGIVTEITQMERELKSSMPEQTKLQLLSEVGGQRTNTLTTIGEIESRLLAHETHDGLHEVKATHTGYLHYLIPLKEGMTVQRMQTIAEISENEQSQMKIEAFIDARDISKVETGQEVKVAIDGVNVQKFGTIKGTIQFIDNGTTTQETEQGNMLFYRCLISIEDTQLTASSGESLQATKSMPVTARIVYDRETYFHWILKLLNFTNK